MSKVKIEGNASGTGTFTITSPDSSTDRTITLPDATGDLVSADASGNVSVTGNLTVGETDSISITPSQITITDADSNQPRLLLKNTNADSTPPFLDFQKDSASPADSDVIGKMRFIGDDDGGNTVAYATIVSTSPDVSDGSENGDLRFETVADGTNAERMRIDSSGNISVTGYVKQAAIPAIHLDGNNSSNNSLSSGTVITTSTYMTDSAGHAFSQGGMSWNSTTGAITVPVAGVYRVSAFAYVNSTDVGRVSIYANGSEKVIINVTSPTTNSLTASGTTILDLAADDYVDLRVASFAAPISIYTGTKHIGFSMEFVG